MLRHWLQTVLKVVVMAATKSSGIRVASSEGPARGRRAEGERAIRHTQQERAASHK